MFDKPLPQLENREAISRHQDKVKSRFDGVVDRREFSGFLQEKGVEEQIPLFNPDTAHRHERNFYLINNPGIQKRFDLNRVIKDQVLPPNLKIKLMEVISGIVPFIKTIPVDVQRDFETKVDEMFPPGYQAKMQGVIMQEEYSSLMIADSLGLEKPSLQYPRVEIHIYDDRGEFVETLVLNFIDSKTQKRISKVNSVLEGMSPDERAKADSEIDDFFKALDSNGLADKLVTHEKSVGYMAKRVGLTRLDVAEGLLKYGNVKDFLLSIDVASKKLKLSEDQKLLLIEIQKRVELDGMDPNERLLPVDTSVVDLALKQAREAGSETSITAGLTQLAQDLHAGSNHYYHNAVRIEGMDKVLRNGEQSNAAKLGVILKSGHLLPREGTFTKGEYLAGIDFGKDDLFKMLPLMLESHATKSPEIVIIFEVAKNLYHSLNMKHVHLHTFQRTYISA